MGVGITTTAPRRPAGQDPMQLSSNSPDLVPVRNLSLAQPASSEGITEAPSRELAGELAKQFRQLAEQSAAVAQLSPSSRNRIVAPAPLSKHRPPDPLRRSKRGLLLEVSYEELRCRDYEERAAEEHRTRAQERLRQAVRPFVYNVLQSHPHSASSNPQDALASPRAGEEAQPAGVAARGRGGSHGSSACGGPGGGTAGVTTGRGVPSTAGKRADSTVGRSVALSHRQEFQQDRAPSSFAERLQFFQGGNGSDSSERSVPSVTGGPPPLTPRPRPSPSTQSLRDNTPKRADTGFRRASQPAAAWRVSPAGGRMLDGPGPDRALRDVAQARSQASGVPDETQSAGCVVSSSPVVTLTRRRADETDAGSATTVCLEQRGVAGREANITKVHVGMLL